MSASSSKTYRYGSRKLKHEEMVGKITKFPAFSSQLRVHYSTIFETKKGKRGREKLYSNHSVRIMASTRIPASMWRVHKSLISKAKEQTKAQEQAEHQPT